jgi:hypothetical protein
VELVERGRGKEVEILWLVGQQSTKEEADVDDEGSVSEGSFLDSGVVCEEHEGQRTLPPPLLPLLHLCSPSPLPPPLSPHRRLLPPLLLDSGVTRSSPHYLVFFHSDCSLSPKDEKTAAAAGGAQERLAEDEEVKQKHCSLV